MEQESRWLDANSACLADSTPNRAGIGFPHPQRFQLAEGYDEMGWARVQQASKGKEGYDEEIVKAMAMIVQSVDRYVWTPALSSRLLLTLLF